MSTMAQPEVVPDVAATISGELWARWISEDAPPMSIADTFHEAWCRAGRAVERPLCAQSGHGFGPRTQSLPSDGWIERFHDWMQAEGLAPAHSDNRQPKGT